MIARPHIAKWQDFAPWKQGWQVEQDLVISRVLVALFSDTYLKERLAFRGGTALHKLHLNPAPRYSEDIDLVQVNPEPIKPILKRIDEVITFFDRPRNTRVSGHGAKVLYRFESEQEGILLRLKIEINTKEHFSVLGLTKVSFAVNNPWFRGEAEVNTYELEEMLGTKLRALFQRSKGRDLFDLDFARKNTDPDWNQIIEVFQRYIEFSTGKKPPSKREFALNMEQKAENPDFEGDIYGLLREGIHYDQHAAFDWLFSQIIPRL